MKGGGGGDDVETRGGDGPRDLGPHSSRRAVVGVTPCRCHVSHVERMYVCILYVRVRRDDILLETLFTDSLTPSLDGLRRQKTGIVHLTRPRWAA